WREGYEHYRAHKNRGRTAKATAITIVDGRGSDRRSDEEKPHRSARRSRRGHADPDHSPLHALTPDRRRRPSPRAEDGAVVHRISRADAFVRVADLRRPLSRSARTLLVAEGVAMVGSARGVHCIYGLVSCDAEKRAVQVRLVQLEWRRRATRAHLGS